MHRSNLEYVVPPLLISVPPLSHLPIYLHTFHVTSTYHVLIASYDQWLTFYV